MSVNTAPSSRFTGVFAPLANVDFRRLLCSNTLWWQVSMMEMIVMGWLALEMTNSAWQVALVGFFRSMPFSGLWLYLRPHHRPLWSPQDHPRLPDNFHARLRRHAALLWTNTLVYWQLCLGAVIIGSAWSLDWPARRSLLPDLVGKGNTVEAMMLESFVQNVSRMAGPFLAGVLIATAGALGCYVVLAILSLAALLFLVGLAGQPVPRNHMPSKVSAFHLMGEGLRYVRSQDPLLGVIVITAILNGLVFSYTALLPVFARDILDVGPIGLGLLGAASGVGALLGLAMIGSLRHRISRGWIFGAGCFLQAIMIMFFAGSTLFVLSLVLLVISGIGQACFGTMQSSIILIGASDEMRSRAMGTLVLAIGAGPLGRLQTGLLAEAFGAPFAVGIQSALAAVLIVVVMVKLPGMRRRLEVSEAPAPVGPVRQTA
ncbi:MAG: MFS transporter [Caldilineaceae bacterium]|nr:MFS transporter [Caldilineaceae bacterium]